MRWSIESSVFLSFVGPFSHPTRPPCSPKKKKSLRATKALGSFPSCETSEAQKLEIALRIFFKPHVGMRTLESEPSPRERHS